MGGKRKLLCMGHDPVLNRTRRLILQRCFDVRAASQMPEAVALLTESRFDLVLLCYSLSEDECRAVVEFVHGQGGKTKILALAQGRRRLGLNPPDEEFCSGGPVELLRKTAEMAGIATTDWSDCGGEASSASEHPAATPES